MNLRGTQKIGARGGIFAPDRQEHAAPGFGSVEMYCVLFLGGDALAQPVVSRGQGLKSSIVSTTDVAVREGSP